MHIVKLPLVILDALQQSRYFYALSSRSLQGVVTAFSQRVTLHTWFESRVSTRRNTQLSRDMVSECFEGFPGEVEGGVVIFSTSGYVIGGIDVAQALVQEAVVG